LSYSRLKIELKRKCKMFSTYVAILNNKETLKNLRIKTKLSVANTCRDLVLS